MNYRHFKYEGWLYGLAFLLALGLRLIGLGAMSLNDGEAALALQALHLAQGLKPILSPHPAYILFTTPLFFLYGGGTNFLARFIPALVGSSLIFAPLLFADRLKPRPSLLLAFFIAFDAGLTAISRQAGSPILAITFLVFAFGFLNQQKPRLAGAFAGLALLGGPAIWSGVLGLAITWAIYQAVQPRVLSRSQASNDEAQPINFQAATREASIPLAVTFLVAGTLFFIVPNGLSAALSSIPAYLGGWLVSSTMRIGWALLALPVYQPFGILLSIIAIIRGWKDGSRRIIPLSIWLIVSLLLAIFYPSRQVADLAWTLIPLLALAGLELARYVDVQPNERREAIGAILLTVFLWIFGWLNFAALVWLSPGQAGYSLRLGLVIGSFILLIFSLLLVAFGWSARIAQLGAVWGLGLGLGILGLGGTIGSMGLHGLSRPELWWPQDIPMQEGLLTATVDDLSEWGKGYDNAVPVVIVGVNSPALEWALREHQPSVVKTLDITSSPEIVITNDSGDPNLAAAYRGQDFIWRLTTSWEVAQPANWFRWLVYREMTQTGENIILWAREDLFLSSKTQQ
jgi:hypothetical protein